MSLMNAGFYACGCNLCLVAASKGVWYLLVPISESINPTGGPNVAKNDLQSTSHSRLCGVAALLPRLHPAQAQVDGHGRSATSHRYTEQLPLFRAGLYSPGRRRQSA